MKNSELIEIANESGVTESELKENPYTLLLKSEEVTFDDLDSYALKTLSIPQDDKKRIAGAVTSACFSTLRSGSTVWNLLADKGRKPSNTIQGKVTTLLLNGMAKDKRKATALFDWVEQDGSKNYIIRREVFLEGLESTANIMKLNKRQLFGVNHTEDGRTFFRHLATHYSEWQIGTRIAELLSSESPFNLNGELKKVVDSKDISSEKKRAIMQIPESMVSFVIGEAGTGKTTLLLHAIESFLTAYPDAIIRVASPTGQASRNIIERAYNDEDKFPKTLTYFENYKWFQPSTAHRLLQMRATNNGNGRMSFHHNKNPLTADILFVDEMSMMDLYMTRNILWAVKNGTHVVFIGDGEQLPSIRAGNTLVDLTKHLQKMAHKFDNPTLPAVTVLTQVERQEEFSPVHTLAHRLLHEPEKFISALRHYTKTDSRVDWFLTEEDEETALKAEKIALFEEDAMVLTTRHEGKAGRLNLNQAIHEKKQNTKDLWPVGTPIIQNRTHHDSGIFNGEKGVIEKRTKQAIKARFTEERTLTLTPEQAEDMWLHGYVSTVHKAQGSEAEHVIIPMSISKQGTATWNITLLYTALTRARTKVTIIGSESLIAESIYRKNPLRRTNLTHRTLTKLKQMEEGNLK